MTKKERNKIFNPKSHRSNLMVNIPDRILFPSHWDSEETEEMVEIVFNSKSTETVDVEDSVLFPLYAECVSDDDCVVVDTEEDENFTKSMEQLTQLEQKSKQISKDDNLAYILAKRFMENYHVLYLDPPYQNMQLSIYRNHYWSICEDSTLRALIYESLTEQERICTPNLKSLLSNTITFIEMECYRNYLNQEPGFYFSDKDFDKAKYSVVFKNGVYNAKKRKFRRFGDDDDTLNRPYTHALDAYYIYGDRDTSNMDRLLYDATHDWDTVKLGYEYLGYIAIPSREGKALIVLSGVGDSGKSVYGRFAETIFLEPRTYRIDPNNLSNRFAYSNAATAYLYSCFDMETRYISISEASQLKQLSGEQYIRSEKKYQNQMTVPIRFKLLFATNGSFQMHPLKYDAAFYRRVACLPFLYKHTEDELDATLPEKLQQEKDAILSKAVDAISHCIDKKTGTISFHMSEQAKHMKESWMCDVDYDTSFLKEAFSITGDMNDIVAKCDIWDLYNSYYENNRDWMKTRSQQKVLNEKIALLDNRIVYGSSVKSRNTLHEKLPNSVACFKGIRWNSGFLEKYDGKMFTVQRCI